MTENRKEADRADWALMQYFRCKVVAGENRAWNTEGDLKHLL